MNSIIRKCVNKNKTKKKKIVKSTSNIESLKPHHEGANYLRATQPLFDTGFETPLIKIHGE